MEEAKKELSKVKRHFEDVDNSKMRRIKTQQGFSFHTYELPEADAIIFMMILKKNNIWYADITPINHRQ